MTEFDKTGVIIVENRTQLLGTLASRTAIVVGTKIAITDAFRMLKSEIYASLATMTDGEESRLQLYLCHGDLTLAEIADSLNGNGPISRADVEQSQRSLRPIFLAGTFVPAGTAGTEARLLSREGGAIAMLKPRWTWPDGGIGWNWVMFNASTAGLADGALVSITAKNWGLWVGA